MTGPTITVPADGRPEDAPGADTLVGVNGNAYAVMGATKAALKRAGASPDFIKAYLDAATAGDYDHLLATSMAFLDAERV